jgi:U3 small nucleolar RNA-associated protein 25
MDLGENVNTPTTRLLTLLNVSALKSRKRTCDEDLQPLEKLNRRKTVKLAEDITLDPGPSILCDTTNNGTGDEVAGGNEEDDGVDSRGTLSVWLSEM